MDRLIRTFAALAVGIGVSLAASGAFAQPKETPCPPASADPTAAQGSAEYEGASAGRETAKETPDPAMGATAEAVGSESAGVKRGGCPDIEPLGTTDQ